MPAAPVVTGTCMIFATTRGDAARRRAAHCGAGPTSTDQAVMENFDVIGGGGGRKACLARVRQDCRTPGDMARAGGAGLVTVVSAAGAASKQPQRIRL